MEFTSNRALARWMEDEGLSPMTLLAIKPKPSGRKRPAAVSMVWGLQDLDQEGPRDHFLAWPVTAEGIEVFAGEGALDAQEECQVSLGETEAGIDVRLEAGGVLQLRCARLTVGEPVPRTRESKPRAHHGSLRASLPLTDVTFGQLRSWLGIEPTALCSDRTSGRVLDDVNVLGVPQGCLAQQAKRYLLWLSARAPWLSISRGKWASDALWQRVWSSVPALPGVTEISSRTLTLAPAMWPATPPPQPAPRVWPHAFGASCDVEGLTADSVRVHLAVSTALSLTLDPVDGQARPPSLTMKEAARHGMASGALRKGADGPPLVVVHASVREGTLGFQRQPACDAPTWNAIWRGAARLPGLTERHSRTTRSPPDPWPETPPDR